MNEMMLERYFRLLDRLGAACAGLSEDATLDLEDRWHAWAGRWMRATVVRIEAA